MGHANTKRKHEKWKRRREAKREAIAMWLTEYGAEVDDKTDARLIRSAYSHFGYQINGKQSVHSHSRVMAHYNAIQQWIGGELPKVPVKPAAKKKTVRKKPEKVQTADAFYRSHAWRRLRYVLLQRYDARCMLCGQNYRDHGVIVHVDHIKPIRLHWDLRLDIENLQVLCEECNHGKGSKYSDDWRPASAAKPIAAS